VETLILEPVFQHILNKFFGEIRKALWRLQGFLLHRNWVHHVSHPLSICARNLWLISSISILQGRCQGGDLEDKEVHRSSSQVYPGSPSTRDNLFFDDRWHSWIQAASLKHIPVNLQIRASLRECGNHNGQIPMKFGKLGLRKLWC
jgi:hypothetical protein